MKVVSVLGTRPEIIRLSEVIPLLDRACQHVLVHTGQNYDPALNEIFFRELGVRSPDHFLGAKGTFGEQLGLLLPACERILATERPDRFLVLGDTNSALAAIVARRMRIPVYHLEAGNRAFDDRIPEELNRRLIDHASDVLMPYTERSRQNLLREGIASERIFVTGNPIHEVLRRHRPSIQASEILSRLGLQANRYFLVTLHRAENVDIEPRLRQLSVGLQQLRARYNLPVIVSTHPRTRARLAEFKIESSDPGVRWCDPWGLFDFVALELKARCVLTDSGTVQEECAIFRIPNVTLRDSTERPETIECGSNILAGTEPADVLRCVEQALSTTPDWVPPPEYLRPSVSSTVVRIVLGQHGGHRVSPA